MQLEVIIPNYNNSASVTRCLNALLTQNLLSEDTFTITVVDDGSTDNSSLFIRNRYDKRVKLIELENNQGRSTARNTGAFQSDADYVIFVDSDCIAIDSNFFDAYLKAINKSADLIFGQVSTREDGFWNQLQKSTFSNREAEFNAGQYWAYTTQNVCIKRDFFLKCGGFDLAFDKHGFEDRDLFIRLLDLGARPSLCPSANVIHDDKISLSSVTSKMLAAGLYSSDDFCKRHPEHYRSSPYSRIDCRLRPWLKLLDLFAWPIVSRIAKADSSWLENEFIPLRLRIFTARLIYGLHYMHGTALASR